MDTAQTPILTTDCMETLIADCVRVVYDSCDAIMSRASRPPGGDDEPDRA